MKGIPQILQFPVVINWERSLSSQLQSLENRDFLFGDIATQRPIVQKLLEHSPYIHRDICSSSPILISWHNATDQAEEHRAGGYRSRHSLSAVVESVRRQLADR